MVEADQAHGEARRGLRVGKRRQLLPAGSAKAKQGQSESCCPAGWMTRVKSDLTANGPKEDTSESRKEGVEA